MSLRLLAAGVISWWGSGCVIDGSIGKDTEGASTEGSPTSATEPQQDAGATQDESDGGGTTAGGGEGGGTSRGSAGTGPTDVPAVCHPTPDDDACAECRKVQCCAAYEACLGHDGCVCWWECIAQDHTVDQCTVACESGHALYEEMVLCVEGHCDSCPP